MNRPNVTLPSTLMRSGLGWVALVIMTTVGCSDPFHQTKGRLLVVGGGLKAENEAVHRAFSIGAQRESLILVLPTASGVPEESGPKAVEDLQRHAREGQVVELLDLRAQDRDGAHDPDVLARLASADALWFTGGNQSRILDVFRHDGNDTPAHEELKALLDRDGLIAGTSAGAAMMCDPMIAGGRSEAALLKSAADDEFVIKQGMGFVTDALVDQHFFRRGRFGRLVAALELTDRKIGIGVADDRAVTVDVLRQRARGVGDRSALLIDLTQLERDQWSRRGIRVSLLGHGDVADLSNGVVSPSSAKAPSIIRDEPLSPLGKAFGKDVLLRLLEDLALDPTKPSVAESKRFRVILTADESTRFLVSRRGLVSLCAIGVRMDILAKTESAQ